MPHYVYREPAPEPDPVTTYLRISKNRRPLIDNEGLSLEEGNDVA